MKNRIWTLPAFLLAAGFLDRWSTFAIVPMLIVEDDQGVRSLNQSVYGPLSLAIAVLLLVGVALIVRRFCDRATLVKGAWLTVFYSALVLALEQLAAGMRNAGLTVLVYYLYLPNEMFTNIRSFVYGFLPGGTAAIWITAIVFLFAPLLFILAGKPRLDDEKKE